MYEGLITVILGMCFSALTLALFLGGVLAYKMLHVSQDISSTIHNTSATGNPCCSTDQS